MRIDRYQQILTVWTVSTLSSRWHIYERFSDACWYVHICIVWMFYNDCCLSHVTMEALCCYAYLSNQRVYVCVHRYVSMVPHCMYCSDSVWQHHISERSLKRVIGVWTTYIWCIYCVFLYIISECPMIRNISLEPATTITANALLAFYICCLWSGVP